MNLLTRIKNSALAGDSIWAVLGNGGGFFLILVSGIIIANILQSELYGEYGFVKNTMFYACTFFSLGLHYTNTKLISESISENKGSVRSIARDSLILTFTADSLAALIVCLLAAPLARFLRFDGNVTIMYVLAVLIVLRGAFNCQNGILAGLKRYKSIAASNIGSGVVFLIQGPWWAHLWGLRGALAGLIMFHIVGVISNQILIHRHIAEYNDNGGKKYRVLLKFTAPLALNEMAFTTMGWAGIFIVIRMAGSAQYALTTAATQWNAIVAFVPMMLGNVILAHLSSNKKKVVNQLQIMKRMLCVNLACTVLPLILVILCSKWISILYGPSFEGLSIVITVSILASVFSSCANVFYYELISVNRNWTIFCCRSLRDLIGILLAWGLITKIGADKGALLYAISTVIAGAIYLGLLIIAFRFYLSSHPKT